MHPFQRIVLCIFVVIPWPSAKCAMYEGDSCTIKSQSGVCKLGSQCPELEMAVRAGTLSSRDIVSCGFSTVEEIICCPTGDKVVTMNRQTPTSTTPSTTSLSTSSTESNNEDFWLHLLNNKSNVSTEEETTADNDFWKDLLSTTSTTITTPTTTTTPKSTTSKLLIINGKEVDPNQRFIDLTALLSDTEKRPDESSFDSFGNAENTRMSRQFLQSGRMEMPTSINDRGMDWQNSPWDISNANINWNTPQSRQFGPVRGISQLNNNNQIWPASQRGWQQNRFFQPQFDPTVQQTFGPSFVQRPDLIRPVIERPRTIRSIGDEGVTDQKRQKRQLSEGQENIDRFQSSPNSKLIPMNNGSVNAETSTGQVVEEETTERDFWLDLLTTTTPGPLILNGKEVEVDPNAGFIDLTQMLSDNKEKNKDERIQLENSDNNRAPPNLNPFLPNANLNQPTPQQYPSIGFPDNIQRQDESVYPETFEKDRSPSIQNPINPNSDSNRPRPQQFPSIGFPDNSERENGSVYAEPFEKNQIPISPNTNWNQPRPQKFPPFGFPDNRNRQDGSFYPENIEQNRSPNIRRPEMPMHQNGPNFRLQNPVIPDVNWNHPRPSQMPSIGMPAFDNGPRNFEQPWGRRENTFIQPPFQLQAQEPRGLDFNQRPNAGLNIGFSLGLGRRRIRSVRNNWSFPQPPQSLEWQENQDPSLTNPSLEIFSPRSGLQNTAAATHNSLPKISSSNPFLNKFLNPLVDPRPSAASSNDPIAKVNENLINSGFEIIKANVDVVQGDFNRFNSNDNNTRATTTTKPRSRTSESASFRFPTEQEDNNSNLIDGWRRGQSNSEEQIDPRRVWSKQSKKPTRRPTAATTTSTTLAPVTTRTTDRPAVVACREIDDGLDNALTPHILGGTPAELGEFPHMAVIGYRSIGNDREPYDYRCGGTLIASRFVLTAAHCVTRIGDEPAVVLLGTVNLTDSEERSTAQEIPVRQVHIHPEYSNSRTYHDVAVLQLEREATYSPNIYPTCLYTDFNDPPANLPVYVTGFGKISTATRERSSILLKAKLEVVSVRECNVSYVENGLNRRINEGVQTRQMCAHDPGFTRDACQGDSGGPLNLVLDESTKKYRVIGIISAGFSCGSATPGLYARVAAYLDFIESIVWPN